jgi:RsiW-degrading membrane proteinase PrsW (M82 family)
MPIVVSCECGGRFRARDELAGRAVNCPKCGRPLTIPDQTYALAEEPPEPPVHQMAPPLAFTAPTPAAPRPVINVAAPARLSSGRRSMRDWLYLALALTLVPLLWSTFHMKQETSMEDRLRQTIRAHPESRDRIVQIFRQDHVTADELFAALPNHRLEGAFLEYGSKRHWLFALIGAAAFFGLALLMLPAASAKPLHVFYTGLFTGTAGVLLLLAVQFIASAMRGRIVIPRSVVGLIFLVLKGIQLSYDAANDPNSNFFLSALGFTFGVGLCEELCKALPLLWYYRHHARLDWRGACLWGFLSGVGFGVSEAIMYSADHYNGFAAGQTYLVRFISCVGLHGIWAAAAGIFIYKHQNLIQNADTWYNLLISSAALVSVPMVLHGLYDTMLKKDMNTAALCVAVASFAWLVFQIEQALHQERKAQTGAALSYA